MELEQRITQTTNEVAVHIVFHRPGSAEGKRLRALKSIDEKRKALSSGGRKRQIGEPIGPGVRQSGMH